MTAVLMVQDETVSTLVRVKVVPDVVGRSYTSVRRVIHRLDRGLDRAVRLAWILTPRRDLRDRLGELLPNARSGRLSGAPPVWSGSAASAGPRRPG